jgi:hypothetical protein
MADEYGALVLIDTDDDGGGTTTEIRILLMMAEFAVGRDFQLSGQAA